MAYVGFTQQSYPDVVGTLLQQKMLQREFEEGLESQLAYRRIAEQDTIPGNIGETLTRTRTGRLVPVETPLTQYTASDLDNGMTAKDYTIERYTFTTKMYGDTQNLSLMQNAAQIANDFTKKSRNAGVQAAQSLDRIARQKLFNAYLGGNTRVIANPGSGIVSNGAATAGSIADTASGEINVDDTRGFLLKMTNGDLSTPTSADPLACKVTTPAGAVIDVQVTAITAYAYAALKSAADITTSPGAIPGRLTIKNVSGTTTGAATWTTTSAQINPVGLTLPTVSGDALTSNVGPAIFRAGGRRQMQDITSSDLALLSQFEDGVTYLKDNGVPTMPDGTYWVISGNTTMRQLFADPRFQVMYQGSGGKSEEYKNGQIVSILGLTFIPTTEEYVQGACISGGPRIRRPIICGAEALVQGDFEGMDTFLNAAGFSPDDIGVANSNGVLVMVRPPLDRLRLNIAISWAWAGDYAVPSDLTADATIIPTASKAMYKRCAVIEHAGA